MKVHNLSLFFAIIACHPLLGLLKVTAKMRTLKGTSVFDSYDILFLFFSGCKGARTMIYVLVFTFSDHKFFLIRHIRSSSTFAVLVTLAVLYYSLQWFQLRRKRLLPIDSQETIVVSRSYHRNQPWRTDSEPDSDVFEPVPPYTPFKPPTMDTTSNSYHETVQPRFPPPCYSPV